MNQDKVVAPASLPLAAPGRGTPADRQWVPVSMRAAFLTWAVLISGALAGCLGSKSCTLIGCQDQFRATVVSSDGTIPSGTHALEVTADGSTISCTFQVPLAAQTGGGTAFPQCPPGLLVSLGQASTCTSTMTTSTTSTTSTTCVPATGHLSEDITVTGKPGQVHVRLTVDGVVVLDRTETPIYHSTQPNGPDCDPTCHLASATWMFSAS